jgi:hypothetical protein
MSQATPFPLAEAEMNEGPLLTGLIYSMNVRDVGGSRRKAVRCPNRQVSITSCRIERKFLMVILRTRMNAPYKAESHAKCYSFGASFLSPLICP